MMLRRKGKMIAGLGLLVSFILLPGYASRIDSVASDQSKKPELSSVPVKAPPPIANIRPYSLRVGEKLYTKYCEICHGAAGDGKGFNAYTLEVQPRDFTNRQYMNALADSRLAETIREGGRGVNKSVLMQTWGGTLSPLEINYLVQYLRQFSP